MPGTHPGLTPQVFLLQEHVNAVESLKTKLAAAGHATLPAALVINRDVDATLLRFLRARKYNVDLAFAMLESKSSFVTRSAQAACSVCDTVHNLVVGTMQLHHFTE